MQVISWEQFLKDDLPLNGKQSSMTAGIFDGVHLGHQSLLKCVVSYNSDYIPVVFTFKDNHKIKNKDIQSFQERLAMFESIGIQITIAVDFTNEFKHIPGIEFLKLLLKHGNVGFFAVGSDFCCGYKLDTDAAAIQKFFAANKIPAEIVPEVLEGNEPISSSRIREAIAAGNLLYAEKMLGYTIL